MQTPLHSQVLDAADCARGARRFRRRNSQSVHGPSGGEKLVAFGRKSSSSQKYEVFALPATTSRSTATARVSRRGYSDKPLKNNELWPDGRGQFA